MQLPLQRYAITAPDGAPAFVDPTLFALALRLPLKDCIQRGIRCGWAGPAGCFGSCTRCSREITPSLQLTACFDRLPNVLSRPPALPDPDLPPL